MAAKSRGKGLERRDVEATLQPFLAASPLPGPPFHDATIFSAELDEIFSRLWLCVGHGDAVAEPGDFMLREIGDECALIVRDKQGAARAFFNVCRHRGTQLLEESEGSGLECVRCPYHAWTYDLDGSLIAAPLMDDAKGFDKADFPLVPIRLEEWQGFLFLNFDAEAGPVAEALADFPDISRFGCDRMRLGARHEYDIAANWKLICENYGECYHCPTNHPQLNPISNYRSGGDSFEGAFFCGGPMRLNEGCKTMTLDGQTNRDPIEGIDPEDHELVHYFNIYPAFLLSLHPDYVLAHTLWPMGPDRTRIICEWLFPPEAAEQADFDPSDAVDFWHMTNEQDWRICARAQKGVQSRGYRPGRYQALEETIHFFDAWYLRTMVPALLGEESAG